jgi:hypothetical protein
VYDTVAPNGGDTASAAVTFTVPASGTASRSLVKTVAGSSGTSAVTTTVATASLVASPSSAAKRNSYVPGGSVPDTPVMPAAGASTTAAAPTGCASTVHEVTSGSPSASTATPIRMIASPSSTGVVPTAVTLGAMFCAGAGGGTTGATMSAPPPPQDVPEGTGTTRAGGEAGACGARGAGDDVRPVPASPCEACEAAATTAAARRRHPP